MFHDLVPAIGCFRTRSWQENGFKSINEPRKFRPHWFSCNSEMLYPIHLASADGDKQQMLLGTSDMHGLGAYMKHDMKGPTVYPEEIIILHICYVHHQTACSLLHSNKLAADPACQSLNSLTSNLTMTISKTTVLVREISHFCCVNCSQFLHELTSS